MYILVMSALSKLLAHDEVHKYTEKKLAYSILLEGAREVLEVYSATSGPLVTVWDSYNFKCLESLQKVKAV